MNYGGNMPDWHQYNSSQAIGSEVPVSQNANHSPIFGPNISPRRLNGPTFSPEGLNKPQNEGNFNTRNFQQSPTTLNGPNVPPENSPMGSAAQMSSCHGPYGAPSPRNTMVEGTSTSLDFRNVPSSSLNESIGQRNHQISMSRPAAHLNCSTLNGSMGPMGQRNTTTTLQGPIPTSRGQGLGPYIPCKLPCCNPDSNISYQSWEKFGPYPPNVPYRDAGYPVDNRRFANDFENREQLGTGPYNIDPGRNFPDYKYRKDPIIPRTYAHPTGVIQNYPIQNYNFPTDYQKYPAYPIKEYTRESSITNPQNPGLLKYQEQSVIVQQKYFTKQIQYPNGVIPKNIVPNNMGGSVISRAQNPYFNPQLARDFPRSYSDSNPLANRGSQTINSMHASYPKYQQKIAMQRFSMENHLRELTRIPGYQSHPKYQESVLRYRELLRLQQSVDYQSTVQDPPKVLNSQINEEIPPINLQFDQNGHLINSNFVPPGFSNIQTPINLQNSKNSQGISNIEVGPLNLQHSEQFKTQGSEVGPLNLQHSQQFKAQPREVGPLNLQHSQQFKTQASTDNHLQNQTASLLSQTELARKNEQHYSTEKDQLHMEKYESEGRNLPNSNESKTSSLNQRNSRDFADKPELDVRQFLANWDESEDEDGTNTNLPDVVLSNSTSGVVEYEGTHSVSGNLEESKNCSEMEDCRDRNDCGIFANAQNELKPSNSTNNEIYACNLPPPGEHAKSTKQDSDISDPGKPPVRTGTVIQPTKTERKNEMTLHIIENFEKHQAPQEGEKLSCRETESLNNDGNQEPTDPDEIFAKKELSVEERPTTSLKEHIKAYNQEANTEVCSSIEETIGNNDDSSSSSGRESTGDTKHHFSSCEDWSESGDSNSMDTNSISSYMKSPRTIKGTEIHVDAQELSVITVPPKSNSEIVDGTNLQKQNSIVSEESHNPDDISLPDLPTSECTPISTTLNTPIHSDSEESSEPVIDLSTPANPIEIIPNSPMLSFTHSSIKMEPYDHLDENDLTDKVSHDALEFEFQGSNSCDNDYERLTDASSNTTEKFNIPENEEDTLDSNYVEILSEKSEPNNEVNTCEVGVNDDVGDEITNRKQFAFNESTVMTSDKVNTTANGEHQPWSSIIVRQHKHQISTNTEQLVPKTDMDKLETLSDVKDKSTIMSEVNKNDFKNDITHISSAKNDHSTSRWQNKCEMENERFESTDNMTALNLVKDEIKIKDKIQLNSIKINNEAGNSEVVTQAGRNYTSDSNERTDLKDLNQSECNSSMENKEIFTDRYATSSEESKIYTERIQSQSNFTGSLNIPLIPGEDFEEPKMPVLPMEGNCLTKIIKNTSPITDLDVLGSDDEKLDKMDEIWMEVGSVETSDKVPDVNIESHTESADTFDREKSMSSRIKPRKVQKNDWKCLKNSMKPKDPSKLYEKVYNDNPERSFESTSIHGNNLQKESEPFDKDFQRTIVSGTDDNTVILQEKDNLTIIPIISKVTSNSYFREDGKQTRDTCSENNATEASKCKEKANHINDIATKLWENARLFEPELRKLEVERKESSYGENSRDGSKKRIKLLKEFRKVKNKININRPGIEAVKPQGAVENKAVSSIEITEEYKKVDEDTMEADNKIIKHQNAFIGTIKNVLQKSDSMIMIPISNVDSRVIEQLNVNTEENTLHALPSDIAMPGEKLREILSCDNATLKNEGTSRESCSFVNMEDNITIEGGNNIENCFDIKIVSPVKEDIDECAINLSKSSNDSDLLQTLSEKGCVTNDSHDSCTSEHNMRIEEPTEIETKVDDETICTESKDGNSVLLQSLYPDDSLSSSETVEKDDENLEVNIGIKLKNVTEADSKSSSASASMISSEECIVKEDTKQEIDQELKGTADHEESVKCISNPEDVEDLAKSCGEPEKIVDIIPETCESCTDICENNDDEKAVELIKSLNDSEETSLPNDSSKKEISVKSIENLSESVGNVSKEGIQESVETRSEINSESDEERNISKLSDVLVESERKIDNDGSISIQKTLQDLDMTTEIHVESKTIDNDLEIIEEPPTANESLGQMQLEKGADTECLPNRDSELISGTDPSLSTVDATLEAFGIENSFDDFSNFDVAPNSSHTEDTDQSNSWKYSKAYARFEDCERYKNPDNFVDPILPSLETLDNLNTVPVYTTKDGKITYSPNPKYTYRALIMEAREREGYPALRKSYCANSRAQEPLNYSQNQGSFRKRKNSDAYSYSGSYGKKNYFDYFEPREHGESSMRNSPEPWNRSYFKYDKYGHQSRDRNLHHSTAHSSDLEKKYSTENIVQERGSVHREGHAVFDDHNKRRNGTSDSSKCTNKKQYKQSREESTSNSTWSGSKQNPSEIALSRSEANRTTNEMKNKMKNKSFERSISSGKNMNDSKNGNRSKDFQQKEKFTSTSEKNKHITESSTKTLQANTELSISRDTLFVGKEITDSKVETYESSFTKTEDKPSNDQTSLDNSNQETNEELTIKQGLFSSEWEDSCENLTIHQKSSCEMKMPSEPLLNDIKEICDKESVVNKLYDEVDDVYRNKTTDINDKKLDDTDLSNSKCVKSSNLVESPIRNERFEEVGCSPEVLNIDRGESTINITRNEGEAYSISAELIHMDENADKPEITEISETLNKSVPEASSNEGAEETTEEDKLDELLDCRENCFPEVKNAEHEDMVRNKIHTDKQNEVAAPIELSNVHENLVHVKSNERISHSSEHLYNIEKTDELERKEVRMKSSKIKAANKNGTSVNNTQQATDNSLPLKMITEFENTLKPQSQFENYISYSPSDENPEDTKVIPKLVIKKTDSSNCKNVCLDSSHDAFVEKVSDKEEHGCKASVHPKIPKILIRNAKSRPSTPSIEEITEKKIFSVSSNEESKVPKVKIRIEDKKLRSPTASSSDNILKTDSTGIKIPKIKIKLEDRLPKVFIKNIDMDSSGPNKDVPKTIPKMKIKKFKGALRQIVDTQILPVSIPRMFIYTELDTEKERATQVLGGKEVNTSDKSSKSVASDSIQEDEKTGKDFDLKKIPILKIKRQSSGCSVEINRKRHSLSPLQSELKKVKKSSKLAESDDKKQLTKVSVGSEHQDNHKRLDNFSVKQSHELDSSENVKHTSVAQSSESVTGEQAKSPVVNIPGTPEEIPKVIIKRASPSAEFKCELSKVKRDAIIKNKRWQPEVKLQRSWVLDCMAKDLNLDKLRLKLATPNSILKKSSPQKKLDVAETQVKNGDVNACQSEKKLIRSKSTSELVPVNGSFGILGKNDTEQPNERSGTNLHRELDTPKRCKSDLGSTFSNYSKNFESRKKLKHKDHSTAMELTSKPGINCANETENSSSIQSVEKDDIVAEKYQLSKDLKISSYFTETQSQNGVVHLTETSVRNERETVGETSDSKMKISTRKINSLLTNSETSERSFVDSDLDAKISSDSANNSKSICESFENSEKIINIFDNNLKIDEIHQGNDSHSHYSAIKRRDRLEVLKDSVIVKNTIVDTVKRHTKSGKKHTKNMKNQVTNQDKTLEFENNGTSAMEHISTNCIDEKKACNRDRNHQIETLTDDIRAPNRSLIFQAPLSMKPDISIPELSSEIYPSGTFKTVDNIEAPNCKNNIYKLDINDNSEDNVKKTDDSDTVNKKSISYNNIVAEEDTSGLNGNVLITSVNNAGKWRDADAKDLQDTEIFDNPNNRSDSANHGDIDSANELESSDESQKIIDILSDSPSFDHSEVEIQLCPDVIEENGICLYHEDAIPTQFELELEIIDNTVPDPLEVPMPQNDQPIEEFRAYAGGELYEESQQLRDILSNSEDSGHLDDSNSDENNSQVCSLTTYQNEVFAYSEKEDTILSVDIHKRKSTNNSHMKTSIEFDSKVEKSFDSSDSLIKEVLAAKERLRKCLAKTEDESRAKFKTRPKTAAEKKQGSSFVPNRRVSSEENLTKLENHSSISVIAEANSSERIVENFSSANNSEKLFHKQTKTEFKVNKVKSERKHSKGSKNNLLKKKYSSLPKNIEKYTSLTQVEGHLIPKYSSIDIKDKREFTKGETTISLKNSKYLIKNHSYSDLRKKMPELINSKDSKYRSKSSRHDGNSKYVGKTKSALSNTVVQESSLDFGQSEEKSVSDAAKHKYKSTKTSSGENGKSTSHKAKLKLYKIPKISKSTHPENERLTEELEESQSKEARMPILEPQVDLNRSLELSEFSGSDRETTRSPPVITNQESRADRSGVSPRQAATSLENEVPDALPYSGKETTVADIVNDMAYHEKAIIRHRRYCTLCERWFPTVAKYRRHLSGYQHRHTELTQRRTIHALFTLFTGRPCPRLQPPGTVRIDCEPGELTPLQIAVQGVTKESNEVDGNIKKPTRNDK